MNKKVGQRLAAFGSLGAAGLELAKAESTALSGELKGSGRALTKALLLIALGFFTLFWALGALAFLGVEILAQWLPRWQAAAIVLGALLLLTAVLAGVGWRRIKRLETPIRTVQRRIEEHQEWWRRRFGPVADSVSDRTDEPG